MKHQVDRGTTHHLHMMKLELSKTNQKLDVLIDLLTKLIKDNIKIHNNK